MSLTHSDSILDVTFYHHTIITSCADGYMYIWNRNTMTGNYDPVKYPVDHVMTRICITNPSVAYVPNDASYSLDDEIVILAAVYNSSIYFYHLSASSLSVIDIIEGAHDGCISSISISPTDEEGRYFVATVGQNEKQGKIWKVPVQVANE